MTRAANAAKAGRLRAPARPFLGDPLIERLAEHFGDVPPELREFGEAAHALGRPARRGRRVVSIASARVMYGRR